MRKETARLFVNITHRCRTENSMENSQHASLTRETKWHSLWARMFPVALGKNLTHHVMSFWKKRKRPQKTLGRCVILHHILPCSGGNQAIYLEPFVRSLTSSIAAGLVCGRVARWNSNRWERRDRQRMASFLQRQKWLSSSNSSLDGRASHSRSVCLSGGRESSRHWDAPAGSGEHSSAYFCTWPTDTLGQLKTLD